MQFFNANYSISFRNSITNTIDIPKDNTLKEKFSSFEYVNNCYQQDKTNLNQTADFLGESDEIKGAYTLSRNSLKQAFSEEIISKEQVREFQQSKNMLEMETKRENSLSNSNQTKYQI